MAKDVILTGIRANNDLHIGNYFGAMLPMIDMAKTKSSEYQINMFIPDLHSFTTPIDYTKLYDSILNNARVYAAAGLPLDNENIYLYRQSQISAHSEMTWILDCFTGFGEMSRMTQFKEKSKINPSEKRLVSDLMVDEITKYYQKKAADGSKLPTEKEVSAFVSSIYDEVTAQIESSKESKSSVGLFNYPVLMAADILLYNTKYVPVGDDQTQHLEFTRDIAERLNAKFGDLFTIPEPVKKQHEFFGKDQGLRIKDLVDPTKKMSKSDETGRGVIFLSDTPEAAAKKIMSATTDDKASVAYDKEGQPGISNLLDILTLTRQANGQNVSLQDTIAEFEGRQRYGDFKKVVAEEVSVFLTSFQRSYDTVDMQGIEAKLQQSEVAMREVANTTLLRVQKAVGLRK